MRSNLLYFFCALILLSLSACSGDESTEDLDVFIGVGIGELKLGDKGSVAAEILGSNYTEISTSAGGNDYLYYMLYSNKGIQLSLGVAPDNTDIETLNVRTIQMFDSFAGKTQEGIGIGSTTAEVIAAYGTAHIDSFFNVTYTYDDIYFTIEEDKVEDMTLLSR